MKRQISFVAIFITFFVTSVAGAQVRISNADMKQINNVTLGKGCWIFRGQEGEISNWDKSNRVLKMRHRTADFTMAVACGTPTVIVEKKYLKMIDVRIQNEGNRPGDLAALTRIVFDWKLGKTQMFQSIIIDIKTTSGKNFSLTLKTGPDAEKAVFLAADANKKASNAEEMAAEGGHGGGGGMKLGLEGFWSFYNPGRDGYGTALNLSGKIKTLSPKLNLEVGGYLSMHKYELYLMRDIQMKNPDLMATEYDVAVLIKLNFALAEKFNLFAGVGVGSRVFSHGDDFGNQETNDDVKFVKSNTELNVFGAIEVGMIFWITQNLGVTFFVSGDLTFDKQTKNPSALQNLEPQRGNVGEWKAHGGFTWKQ